MRLDQYITNRYQGYSRSRVRDLIKRGFVAVDDKPVLKPGFLVSDNHKVTLNIESFYASRAGEKLKFALTIFQVSLKDKIIIDVGASTGGFTDVALQEGATHVFAYDVGKGQMVEALKNHPKVTSKEETNILNVILPPNDLCLVDVSFTSVLPILKHLSHQTQTIIFLLKPQFESEGIGLKKGILKDQKVLKNIFEKVMRFITAIGFQLVGFTKSPIKGKDGNQEYVFHIIKE